MPRASAAGRTESDLGRITLRDLGGSAGVPADEIGQEAMRALLDEGLQEAATDELKRKAKGALEGLLK